jgi:hypothetical protein
MSVNPYYKNSKKIELNPNQLNSYSNQQPDAKPEQSMPTLLNVVSLLLSPLKLFNNEILKDLLTNPDKIEEYLDAYNKKLQNPIIKEKFIKNLKQSAILLHEIIIEVYPEFEPLINDILNIGVDKIPIFMKAITSMTANLLEAIPFFGEFVGILRILSNLSTIGINLIDPFITILTNQSNRYKQLQLHNNFLKKNNKLSHNITKKINNFTR